MTRFLMIDIGAGTMDILYFDTATGLHYKAVVRSPVLTLGEKASKMPGPLLVTGVEMGGGLLADILKKRARETGVTMSFSAAATLHHDPDRVRSLGIQLVDGAEAERLRESGKYGHLQSADLELDRIEDIMRGFGVPFSFDAVGICAQDHGLPPVGESHLDYRHRLFKAHLEKHPLPETLLFRRDEVPQTFNRLSAIAETAGKLPCGEVYVMDSGMAAILGATRDPQSRGKADIIVLDLATSHTVGAAVHRGELSGFFEYHTRDVTLSRLEELVVELAEGKLDHESILHEGGHGAYIRDVMGFERVEAIIATGPKRGLLAGSRLPLQFGAPFGDNMMTGTVGLLDAIGRRNGMDFPSVL